MWLAGARALGPSAAAFPRSVSGSWIGSGAVGIQPALPGAGGCSWRLNTLCHSLVNLTVFCSEVSPGWCLPPPSPFLAWASSLLGLLTPTGWGFRVEGEVLQVPNACSRWAPSCLFLWPSSSLGGVGGQQAAGCEGGRAVASLPSCDYGAWSSLGKPLSHQG